MGAHAYGRVYVSLLPVVEACVVVRGRVCEVRVASTADEAEAIIMIVDLTLSYIWRLGNYFVRRLHYAAGELEVRRSYTLYFPMHRIPFPLSTFKLPDDEVNTSRHTGHRDKRGIVMGGGLARVSESDDEPSASTISIKPS